ncbi:hypothetical protein [Myroides odoratimimus]|uniref:hypothetical protein n=1 Tax=Myroides odoratimimus TaxID=76832 RepID=UPI003F431CC5
MAKADNNKETGVEKTPVLTEDKGADNKSEKEVLIRFLLSPAGKFKLPYNVGQEVALHKEVAAEIVESAYAEYVVEVE